jgi:hypothetical protein
MILAELRRLVNATTYGSRTFLLPLHSHDLIFGKVPASAVQHHMRLRRALARGAGMAYVRLQLHPPEMMP